MREFIHVWHGLCTCPINIYAVEVLGILVDAPGISVHRSGRRPTLGYTTRQAALSVEAATIAILEVGIRQEVREVFTSGTEWNARHSTDAEARIHEADANVHRLVLRARVVNGGGEIAEGNGFVPCIGHCGDLNGDDRRGLPIDGDACAQVVGCVDGEGRQATNLYDIESLPYRHRVFGVRSAASSGVGPHVEGPDGCCRATNAQAFKGRHSSGGTRITTSGHDCYVGFQERALLFRHITRRGNCRHQVLAPVVRLVAHHAAPLAAGDAVVVFVGQRNDFVEGILCFLCIIERFLALSSPSINEALTSAKQLDVLVCACTNGVLDELIIRVAKCRWDA